MFGWKLEKPFSDMSRSNNPTITNLQFLKARCFQTKQILLYEWSHGATSATICSSIQRVSLHQCPGQFSLVSFLSPKLLANFFLQSYLAT